MGADSHKKKGIKCADSTLILVLGVARCAIDVDVDRRQAAFDYGKVAECKTGPINRRTWVKGEEDLTHRAPRRSAIHSSSTPVTVAVVMESHDLSLTNTILTILKSF